MATLPNQLAATIEVIERVVAEAAPAEVAELVGHLERLKFLAWTRAQPRTPPAAAAQVLDQDRYLTIGEVAARLGLSKSYCYELARRGALPVTALGTLGRRARAFRIPRSRLLAWEAGLRNGSSGPGLSNMLVHRVAGAEFRGHRERMGMTQVQLAEQLGVHPITWSRWERDQVRVPGPVARLLACSPRGHRRRHGDRVADGQLRPEKKPKTCFPTGSRNRVKPAHRYRSKVVSRLMWKSRDDLPARSGAPRGSDDRGAL
jgi:excisionase family DNA binding protein